MAEKSGDSVAKWRGLLAIYFPVHWQDEIWSYSATDFASLPAQGWKIHVSATSVAAPDVLEAVCRVLDLERVSCKTLHDPIDLVRLNSGMQFGYSQIGKFVTLYPATDDDCIRIAGHLAEATAGLSGPAIPFERRVASGSPVFARYGAFKGGVDAEGELLAPDGEYVPDSRAENPSWAVPPPGLFGPEEKPPDGPLGTRYVAYEAIVQRGKGGVYLALDLADGARKCVLKEGRRFGEVDHSGADGRSRTRDEYANLLTLRARGIAVPQLYDFFEQGGNSYAVLEFIKGRNFSEVINSDLPPSGPSASPRELSLRICELVARIHAVGFVWRDLKATNVIVTPGGEMRPIDFEGSLANGTLLQGPWGTPGHLPAEWPTAKRAEFAHDLFALGALIRQLHVSRDDLSQSSEDHLSGVAGPVRDIVAKLMSDDPLERPPAAMVAEALMGTG